MSTQTAYAPAPPRPGTHNATLLRVVGSEWIKITTLRSTWWSLGVAMVLSVGVSLLIAAASGEYAPPAAEVVTMPVQFTMLVVGILGAIAITGEYSTGMIRSTLAAQPRRGVVLAAKALVLALLIGAATIVTYAIAIAVTTPLLENPIDWGDSAASTVPLLWGVASMITFALIGLGFGFMIRNGAGAIAITVGILFVLPLVLSIFSFLGEDWNWLIDIQDYLPSQAAALLMIPSFGEMLSDVDGEKLKSALTLIGWAAASLLGGWAVIRTRDA